jgi:hypothetical protein
MLPEDVTTGSLNTISLIERLCSTLSLLGCAFIAVTFLFSTAFHKPINRLVFYASLGNIFTNVATLITRSAIPFPNSFLCQFQGFLIQMYVLHTPSTPSLTFDIGLCLLMRAGLLQWP